MARRKREGIKVVEQRSDWDCGVACLAALLPFEYSVISATARTRFPRIRKEGMSIAEMQETAELLGHKLERRYKKKDYLVGRTGVLGVLGERKDFPTAGHWVVLKDGTHVVDPWDATVWKLEDYLNKIKGRAVTLLTP
jgi:ABC-type bacteriocin/lantibiotic exporter with double-glycine peptidase domain